MTVTTLNLEAHANVAFRQDIAPAVALPGYRGVMQLRQYPGAGGSPVVELPPLTVPGEGVQVVSAGAAIRLRIEQETLDAVRLTYGANIEAGKAIVFYYDLVLSPLSGDADVFYEGTFTLKSGVTRSASGMRAIPRGALAGDSIIYANHYDNGNNFVGLATFGEVAWAQARYPNFNIDTWYDAAEVNKFNGANLARAGFLAGPGDDSVSEIGARIARLLLQSPDFLILAIGTNNIRAGQTGAATAVKIEANAQQALDAGVPVVLATIRPYSATYSTANAAIKTQMLACNAALRTWASGRAGVTLWDVFADYDDGSGVAKANFLYDDTHPAMRGAFAAAPRLATILRTLTGGATSAVPTGANRVVNPNMADLGPNGTAGTGVTGTVGTGWEIQRTLGSPTIVAGFDGAGNQTITVTGAGAAAERLRTGYEFGGPPINPGEWIQPTVTLELSAWAGWRNASVKMGGFGGMMEQAVTTTDTMALGAPVRLTLISPPQPVPPGIANAVFQLWLEIDGSVAGSGVATVIEKTLKAVPDPRPLRGIAV